MIRALCLGLAISMLLGSRHAHAASIAMTDAERARAAHEIVIARIDDRNVRWNDRHNLILTEYRLHVDEYLKGSGPVVRSLVSVGGTLDGETQWTSSSVVLEVGARYVLYLGDSALLASSPLVGGEEGLLRDTPTMERSAPGSFEKRVDEIRSILREIPDGPPARSPEPGAVLRMPSKKLDSEAKLTFPSSGAPETPGPAEFTGPDDIARPSWVADVFNAPDLVVIDRLPDSFYPWSPVDQNMMALWNLYGDAFRIYTTPSGRYAYGNDRSEMAGWLDDSQLLASFGVRWGAGVLAVTFLRFGAHTYFDWSCLCTRSDHYWEADIAFNAAYDWTTDLAMSTDGGAVNFNQTVLHELGHAWGLRHAWETQDVWWPSVMNYSPNAFRIPLLDADDTLAISARHPGQSIHDGAVSGFITTDSPGLEPEYTGTRAVPQVIREGRQNVWIGPVMFENVGTEPIVDPRIEVYATPRRVDWSGAHYMGSIAVKVDQGAVAPHSVWYAGEWIQFNTMPPGVYSIGLYYRGDSDAYGGNDSAWSPSDSFLRIIARRRRLIPSADGWGYFRGEIGPRGKQVFSMNLSAGVRYDFSLCPDEAGFSAFDSVLNLLRGGATIASSDNACPAGASIHGVMVPTSGSYNLVLKGQGRNQYGSYELAFRARP